MDYVALYKLFAVVLAEAKRGFSDDADGQVCAQMAASREQYARTATSAGKRRVTELDVVIQVVRAGKSGCDQHLCGSASKRLSKIKTHSMWPGGI